MANILYFKTFIILWLNFISFSCNEIKQKQFSFKGIIAAFGDFNSDKFTDIFLIQDSCIQILKQIPDRTENDDKVFIEDEKLKVCFTNFNEQIVGVIPGDFNGDAIMDIIGVTKRDNNGFFSIYFLKGFKDSISSSNAINFIDNVNNHPLVLDYNGDMISDILVQSVNDSNFYVYFGENSFKPLKRKMLFTFSDGKARNPNSNAFIDLNKDHEADIFIEEENKMYYWYAQKNGYVNTKNITPPINNFKVYGASLFCDLNGDETIDHILPVCKEKNKPPCLILVYDNERDKWVQIVDEIKIGNDEFYFEESKIYNQNLKKYMEFPISLKHGFVNENGYTDLMALMKRKNLNNKDDWYVILFNNKKNFKNNKNFLNVSFEITALNVTEESKPILTTFFDLYEDGVIDILLNYAKKDKKNSETKIQFKSLTLNSFADVNFVKILVTTGLCSDGNCFEKRVTGEAYRVPYGTNYPGSMVCYHLTNANNNAMKSCAGQLSQSANFALQMPYTIFGLGLYANYIEKLTATIPSGNTTLILQKIVEQIVPDSQIVLIPNPASDPNLWRVQFFLTPSDIIYKTLLVLFAFFITLIIIIAILHHKEMLEDVKEQTEFKKQWPELRR